MAGKRNARKINDDTPGMLISRILPLALAALVVAGCSSPSPAANVSATTSAPSTTSSPSAAPHAAVQDFTSVVAEHHADWDDQVATTEANCLNPRTIPACHMGYITLGYMAETIRLSLSAVHKPSAPVYKGVPPAQVKTLLAETESVADHVHLAAKALSAAGCQDPMAPECVREYMQLRMAVDELSRKLDAWSVY